jgi:hypothetical protein
VIVTVALSAPGGIVTDAPPIATVPPSGPTTRAMVVAGFVDSSVRVRTNPDLTRA